MCVQTEREANFWTHQELHFFLLFSSSLLLFVLSQYFYGVNFLSPRKFTFNSRLEWIPVRIFIDSVCNRSASKICFPFFLTTHSKTSILVQCITLVWFWMDSLLFLSNVCFRKEIFSTILPQLIALLPEHCTEIKSVSISILALSPFLAPVVRGCLWRLYLSCPF